MGVWQRALRFNEKFVLFSVDSCRKTHLSNCIISKYDSFPIFLTPYHHLHLFIPPAVLFRRHEFRPRVEVNSYAVLSPAGYCLVSLFALRLCSQSCFLLFTSSAGYCTVRHCWLRAISPYQHNSIFDSISVPPCIFFHAGYFLCVC